MKQESLLTSNINSQIKLNIDKALGFMKDPREYTNDYVNINHNLNTQSNLFEPEMKRVNFSSMDNNDVMAHHKYTVSRLQQIDSQFSKPQS